MSKQAFYVCDDVDSVSGDQTFIWLNPGSTPHTISNCIRVLTQDQYTVAAHSYCEATVRHDAPHGPHQPRHVPECPLDRQPKIIIS
jgi:hypothetical protein